MKLCKNSLQNRFLRIYYREGVGNLDVKEKGRVVMLELRNVSYYVENEGAGKYILNDIRSPRYPLYRDETTLILYDMYKRRKSQNGNKSSTKKRV